HLADSRKVQHHLVASDVRLDLKALQHRMRVHARELLDVVGYELPECMSQTEERRVARLAQIRGEHVPDAVSALTQALAAVVVGRLERSLRDAQHDAFLAHAATVSGRCSRTNATYSRSSRMMSASMPG